MAMVAVVALACAIAGCGQKGSLYLPTEAAARDRATLPQVLVPLRSASAPATPVAPLPSASAAR
jgi:predicted small lipoprotein YifL